MQGFSLVSIHQIYSPLVHAFFFYSQSSENVIVFAWSQLDLSKLAVFVLIEIAPECVYL